MVEMEGRFLAGSGSQCTHIERKLLLRVQLFKNHRGHLRATVFTADW